MQANKHPKPFPQKTQVSCVHVLLDNYDEAMHKVHVLRGLTGLFFDVIVEQREKAVDLDNLEYTMWHLNELLDEVYDLLLGTVTSDKS